MLFINSSGDMITINYPSPLWVLSWNKQLMCEGFNACQLPLTAICYLMVFHVAVSIICKQMNTQKHFGVEADELAWH